MYTAAFGLAQEPFSIAPDPRFLYMSERHREALAHLLYGLKGGGGFVLLTGEVGAGKTTVARCFLEQIPRNCNVAYVFNPKLSAIELLQAVCDEFHVGVPARAGGAPTLKDHVDALNRFLLDTHAVGQNAVLVIDEAQQLGADVLEQLRLLTNLETNERKLLQIVLIGQPELRELLAQRELAQLAQRVIARYHLGPLKPEETRAYVKHRLVAAGARSMLFERAAVERLHRRARGVPRRINLVADRALLGAYAGGLTKVDAATVDRAAAEVFDDEPVPRGTRQIAAAVALGLGAGAAVVGAAWWWSGGGAATQAPAASAAASGAGASGVPARANAAAASGAGATRPAGVPSALAASAPSAATALAAAPAAPGSASAAADGAEPAAPYGFPDDTAAWRAIAPAFGIAAAPGSDPCTEPARGAWRCLRAKGDPASLRRLDRPMWVTLREAAGERAGPVLVAAIDARQIELRSPGGTETLPLAVFASRWRGEFGTWWRAPAGWREGGGGVDLRAGAGADWVAAQLARLPGLPAPEPELPREESLRAQVRAFQAAQGLPADGIAGPVTLMQLQRATGAGDPRLAVPPR